PCKFLIGPDTLGRFLEFFEVAERLAAAPSIPTTLQRLGDGFQLFKRETVAVAIQPLQICQGSGISFSRRSSSATTADRQWPVIIFRQDLFQPEVYPPVGGEVIFIAERFPPVE